MDNPVFEDTTTSTTTTTTVAAATTTVATTNVQQAATAHPVHVRYWLSAWEIAFCCVCVCVSH